jgi:alkyl hydroperoxide reductase subunit F
VSQFIDFVEKDKGGQIIVNTKNETSVPGVWAAGDVTNVTEKQIAVSVGEGSKASLEIIKWLQRT